jgi:hypothetical protein
MAVSSSGLDGARQFLLLLQVCFQHTGKPTRRMKSMAGTKKSFDGGRAGDRNYVAT